MKILYQSSRFISAVVVGVFVLAASAAAAVPKHSDACVAESLAVTRFEDMGRFVVTPEHAAYIPPLMNMGRFVVDQCRAVYLPAGASSTQLLL